MRDLIEVGISIPEQPTRIDIRCVVFEELPDIFRQCRSRLDIGDYVEAIG